MAVPLIAAVTAVSALGAFQQEQQAAETADFNAKVAAMNAQSERAFASAEEERVRRQRRQQQGQARAAQGASGVEVDVGSFLDVRADDAMESELEALTVLAQGEQRARGFEAQQSAFGMQSSQARKRAPLSALTAAAKTGGPLIINRL